jgi:hypothetical protein
MSSNKNPTCPYCGGESAKTTGYFVYPHVKRLNNRTFYFCDDGHAPAWVGSHRRTGKPLGTLANGYLRKERSRTHEMFDPLWQASGRHTRDSMYQWLAEQMGIPAHRCHVGMFDLEQCEQAQKIIARHVGATLRSALGG